MRSMTEKTRRYFKGNPIPDDQLTNHMRKRRSTIFLKNGKKVFSDVEDVNVIETVHKYHKLVVSEFESIGIWEHVAIEVNDIENVEPFKKSKNTTSEQRAASNISARRRQALDRYNAKVKSDVFNKRLGIVIKQSRLERGWSRLNLAHLCGLSRAAIGSYETGTVHITDKRLEQLARIFECSVSDIKKRAKKLKTDKQS